MGGVGLEWGWGKGGLWLLPSPYPKGKGLAVIHGWVGGASSVIKWEAAGERRISQEIINT